MRFCPSVEVETLDPDKFCGASGFLRYCCTPQIRQFPEGPKKPEEPQEPEEPHEPEEPQEPGKVRCFKDSDCPVTKLPSGFEDTLPEEDLPIRDDEENGRKMYRCMYDYERDDGTKICCDEKCQIDTEEQVYEDLPDWNDHYYEERGIKMSHCLYDYERDDGSKLCHKRLVPFCTHPDGCSQELKFFWLEPMPKAETFECRQCQEPRSKVFGCNHCQELSHNPQTVALLHFLGPLKKALRSSSGG